MPPKIKRFLLGLLAAFCLPVLAFALLWFSSRGDYSQQETVSSQPALPRIAFKDTTLHAETFGASHLPPVVVVHDGPGGDYRSLLPLKALSDQHFILFYDQRGSGLSERVADTELTLEQARQDLAAVIDQHAGTKPVQLLGHGWGGMLAAAYTAEHPQRVTRLVLAEPGFLNAEMAAQVLFAGQRGASSQLLRTASSWGRSFHVPAIDPDARRDFVFGQIRTQAAYYCDQQLPADLSERSWRGGFRAWKMQTQAVVDGQGKIQLDFLKGLDKIQIPVLLLSGECNQITGPRFQSRQQRLFARAALRIVPQSSHDLFWEQPEQSLSVVREYLASGQLPTPAQPPETTTPQSAR
ncbi:MAG: alpha/beta hydrolase [Candidatus Sericytochromatia bacterium]|nr:alpha/beta hydrolase [Candidatus Sericytochromatia bacterium]